MKQIDYIVVHTEGSPRGVHGTVDSIRRYHVEARGWNDIGYHFVIDEQGTLHLGRPLHLSGAHTLGINGRSIGIVVTGNGDYAPFNDRQTNTLIRTLVRMKLLHPNARVIGHREINEEVNAGRVPEYVSGGSTRTPKSCPGARVSMRTIRRLVEEALAVPQLVHSSVIPRLPATMPPISNDSVPRFMKRIVDLFTPHAER